MSFKKLVEEASDILESFYEYNEEKNVYSIKIVFDDDSSETVYIYQDTFEDENDGVTKKIIVCEALVCKYDSSKDLLLLAKSNNDLFFAKASISEDDKILVESCSFMENLTSLHLSVIVNEIAQHVEYLKEEFKV